MLALTAPAFADQMNYEPPTGGHQNVVLDTRTHSYLDEYTPGLRIALRNVLSDRFEIESSRHQLNHRGKPAPGGTAWYRLSDRFSLGLTANLDEDVKGYGVGARIYFGN